MTASKASIKGDDDYPLDYNPNDWSPPMCDACREEQHWLCTMSRHCHCDCDGPYADYDDRGDDDRRP